MRAGDAARRTADVAAAVLAGLVLSPALAAIFAVVLCGMGTPVIFRHRRAGRDGQLFTLYKFRTMTAQTGPDGRPLPDSRRLTAIGRFLRSASLDELPQLWNVLRGEMRIVGPRPLPPEYLPRYNARHLRRHEVRPGITGWAQVHGRNNLSWEEKFELDIWYVERHSPWLDVKILFLTVKSVLRRDGICRQGHASMPEFLGLPD